MRNQITKRICCTALWCLAAASLLAPAPTYAQSGDPDLRDIIPYLMLVIDTSGSMERQVSCTCQTPGCSECLPTCNVANTAGVSPKEKKNRWAITLEALTGTFNNFECESLARTSQNGMTYDIGYFLPYHQPWDCTSQMPGTACAWNQAGVSTLDQNMNGIIDTYSARVQFGLMTFDGFDTYVGAPPLVAVPDFNVTLSNAVQGAWSYAGGHTFHYPNCTTDYMMDTGVRSAAATEGALVSLSSCTGNGTPGTISTRSAQCTQCTLQPTQQVINDSIQQMLIKTRPWGGTPIAASLDDLYYHLRYDTNDQFGSCRNRYALLMTDGYPDDDYRAFGCDCASDPDPVAACAPSNPADMHCPYPKAEQVASDLIHGRTANGDAAQLQQLFVVGLAVDDTNVLTELNKIAKAGCPYVNGCDTDMDGNEALFANDLDKLVSNLDYVISNIIHPVSRSVPAFANGFTGGVNDVQYQIDTGFELPKLPGLPWTGLIERRRLTCQSDGTLTLQDLAKRGSGQNGDRFEDVLNQGDGSLRNLLTVVPMSGSLDGTLAVGSGQACGSGGCSNVSLNDPAVTPATLAFATTDYTSRTNLMNWMYGTGGSVRETRRLGDIYHSSPVIVSAPQFDTSDEAFNLFRQRLVVSSRPLTMYVNSNDGILHAFSMEAWSPPALIGGSSLSAGQEIWGFVPPLLLNDLNTNLSEHNTWLDGTRWSRMSTSASS